MASISPEDIKKPLNKQGFPFLKMRLSCAVGNTKSSCGQQSISRKDPVDSYTSQRWNVTWYIYSSTVLLFV